ncbi:MAG: helix-turn-helix domain-containing protein [Paracoccus sp. (in: a-proteobacteria)]|nr:helix-turn-helix domain-containing protein [Paracoccus sp. (in: a-proteobacteria)]
MDGADEFETRLGDLMRGERATMGKSLLDVQRELRIRASYIAAIENCDVSAFDAPSFISGYVRSYARYLKMDTDWVFQRFCAESGFEPVHGMAPAASGPKPSRKPTDTADALANPRALFLPQKESFWSTAEPRAIGSILVLGLVLGGLGYGGWAVLQELQRVTLTPADQQPSIVTSLDPVQGAAENSAALSELALDMPAPEAIDRIYRPQVLDVPVLTARDGPIAAIDPQLPTPSEIAAAAMVARAEAEGGALPGGETRARLATDYGPQLPAEQMAVRTVAPDAPELELLAVRAAWVRVTSADGTVLLEKTMDAGERFALPKLEEAPRLRTGNSGAIYFAVNGQTYGPARPGAQVVSNLELSADHLREEFAYADPAQDADLRAMVAVASADGALGTNGEAQR